MKKFITKKDAIRMFRDLYNNDFSKFKHDRPALRMSWNNFVDCLCRDGAISDKQAHNWDQPDFVKKG